MTSTTGQEQQGTLELQQEKKDSGPVECLGLTFENEQTRREHFLALLKKKLQDQEFRKIPGFPQGSDEAILRMSDPPYYTACPNPFLEDFVRRYGKPYDPDEAYEREPFAVDVSVGKTDQLYRAHGYHTKVPHLAIVPSILHYTEPGDLVLDGFCGSGMTGVATHFCTSASPEYKAEIEAAWLKEGRPMPRWGLRRSVINDLGLAPSFIAANYNIPFNAEAFTKLAEEMLGEIESELGWMYETLHTDGITKGRINFTVWSEVFSCPHCGGDVVFAKEALDADTKRIRPEFPCPSCGASLRKSNLDRVFESTIDLASGSPWKHISFRPVLIDYSIGRSRFEKQPDSEDLKRLEQISRLPLPIEVPVLEFPKHDTDDGRCRSSGGCCHSAGLADKGFTNVHHVFLPRAAQSLGALWNRALTVNDCRLRNILLWYVEQAVWGMSLLARYAPTHYSQVNQYLNGVYYVGSQIVEVSPWYILLDKNKRTSKLSRLEAAFSPMYAAPSAAIVQTGDCASLSIPDRCVGCISLWR
jgi:hypothetical protein